MIIVCLCLFTYYMYIVAYLWNRSSGNKESARGNEGMSMPNGSNGFISNIDLLAFMSNMERVAMASMREQKFSKRWKLSDTQLSEEKLLNMNISRNSILTSRWVLTQWSDQSSSMQSFWWHIMYLFLHKILTLYSNLTGILIQKFTMNVTWKQQNLKDQASNNAQCSHYKASKFRLVTGAQTSLRNLSQLQADFDNFF